MYGPSSEVVIFTKYTSERIRCYYDKGTQRIGIYTASHILSNSVILMKQPPARINGVPRLRRIETSNSPLNDYSASSDIHDLQI